MTDTPNRTYRIGGDIEVNRIGFGAMRLTGQPGNFGPYEDWEGGISLLRAAADDGVTFFDSARSYGPLGANPMQHGAKLAPREALAWLLERSPNIIAIPGTTSVGHMRQNITAWDLL